MSQTENKQQLDDHLKMLMGGLNGLVETLDATVRQSYSNMGPEEALKFAKAVKENNVPDRIEEIKAGIDELSKTKFD